MATNILIASTPQYVLLDSEGRIGPRMAPSAWPIPPVVIYGFTGKSAYDRFRSIGQHEMRPYPLVQTYLQDEIKDHSDALHLVAVDAMSACEPNVYAATMEAIFEAQQNHSPTVDVTHALNRDPCSGLYHISIQGSPQSHGDR